MRGFFTRMLARLPVGRKLLLIYLLDLSAVIFISGILINEKFIAIDFARKELLGNSYIAAVREALLDIGRAQFEAPRVPFGDHAAAVAAAQQAYGFAMQSAELERTFRESLARLGHSDGDATAAMDAGRALVTRIGNQSNLILDPDLDSYYTMSLLLLRFPDLLEIEDGIASSLAKRVASGAPVTSEERTQYFIREGRLDATAKGIESDYGEAIASTADPRLADALGPTRAALAAAIDGYRKATRAFVEEGPDPARWEAIATARGHLLEALGGAWQATNAEMETLLDARIHGFFVRMWLHLGTALALLGLLLTAVFFVARQIARPLKHLADVADTVSRTGDYALRARWTSQDEIGRLVRAFNSMLDQLDRNRIVQQEMAANARAAAAQQELVDAIPIPLVVTSIPHHEVLHANEPAQPWLEGATTDPWSRGLDSSVRLRLFQQLADHGAVDEFEVKWRGAIDTPWAVLSARRLQYLGRDAVLTAFAPINHLKSLEQRLELWAKVFEASSESIMIMDGTHHLLSVNRAFSRSTGFEFRDVVGTKPSFLQMERDGAADIEPLWSTVDARGAWQGEVWVRRQDGGRFPAWLALTAVLDAQGTISHYIGISIDITDRKASEERIRYLAHHDVLTDLPNRSLCVERLRAAMRQADRRGDKVGVLFIDLDRFKNVNDSLGHHVGDALLRSVAARLQAAVRAGDTVSRLGGDEFVVILAGINAEDEVTRMLEQRIVPLMRKSHTVMNDELHISCSIGIALYPDDGGDIDALMRHADVAMYEAKASGRDQVHFFTEDLNLRAQERLNMENQLRHAIARGELSLCYQPRIDAATGTLRGVEGLLRWHNPELGWVSPRRFIPIAEECGLIQSIGDWVVDEGCRQLAEWSGGTRGREGFTLSLNVSALQLRDPNLRQTIAAALERHGARPQDLELELTESILMESVDLTLRQLQSLKELGVVLSIDDFGTGYSSLTYLSRFPIDKLKIDRSFVDDMLEDPSDRAITMAIIGLGQTLNLQVVAEGVETVEQARVLRAAQCDELQGFLFAQPMPAAEMAQWIARSRGKPAGAFADVARAAG
ncbi:MAG: EAL domain-containing protein [Proteobacteria bacterium]|nr:EAL domain-containing protein [Pseudomonadota bacterium]